VSRRSPVEAAETPAFSGVPGADSEPETAPAALFRHWTLLPSLLPAFTIRI